MKIALVSPYDFAYPGGVANHIQALEGCLTEMGQDVRVIAPASKAVPLFGERFIPIGKPRPLPTSGSIARITISVHLAARIIEILEQEKFDIIHFHEPFMPMLCTAMLRLSDSINIGTFHACHGSPGYRLGWPLTAPYVHKRALKLHGKIAVSKPALEYVSRYIPGDYRIIPNGIELGHFTPGVKCFPQYRDGKKNILFVGRLESRKGLMQLLKAYHQIKKERSDIRLLVVGPGSRMRYRYQWWVKRKRLRDVVFCGYASYDDLPRYYETADIFCSPATGRESFGIVLLEAMAMGKPVLATSIDGYANVVNDGVDGVLVPPKDHHALAYALKGLIDDKERCDCLAEKAKKTAQNYRWRDIARKVMDFYLEVLDSYPEKKKQILGREKKSTAV